MQHERDHVIMLPVSRRRDGRAGGLASVYACGMPNSAVVGSINVFTDAT
jgi:hypothetical protein